MPRGPLTKLHRAVYAGSTKRIYALLSSGSINVDQGDPIGSTPLMYAAGTGNSSVVGILLDAGASTSVANDDGATALHVSAQNGHLATTEMLVAAGADLEAAVSDGLTPLHVAAHSRHWEVIEALVEAGANVDNRLHGTGGTPLHSAVWEGHLDVVRVLLRAKANPWLITRGRSGTPRVLLDAAVAKGHPEVARELLQQLGIDGCGGPSGGIDALRFAAETRRMDMMTILTGFGVIDTGAALSGAAGAGFEEGVKFLLQQYKRTSAGEFAAYVSARDHRYGATPLICCIGIVDLCSPSIRIARLLCDAGADTTAAVQVKDMAGNVLLINTPLGCTTENLRNKKFGEKIATEEQVRRLEAIRRLLLTVEAVHAVSWLWHSGVPSITHAEEDTSRTPATSGPLGMMVPLIWRRAGRRGVVLAPLNRYSRKL